MYIYTHTIHTKMCAASHRTLDKPTESTPKAKKKQRQSLSQTESQPNLVLFLRCFEKGLPALILLIRTVKTVNLPLDLPLITN